MKTKTAMQDKTKTAMQDMVLENMRLAHKIAWDFHGCGIEQEELEGLALLGLVKAASAFNESKGFKFATFAVPVMRNEILMEIRKISRFRGAISLDTVISSPQENGECSLLDLLPCEENGYEDVDNLDLIPSLFRRTNLQDSERTAIILTVLEGKKQKDVAEAMGVSQSYVSRLARLGVNKIRKEYWKQGRKLA